MFTKKQIEVEGKKLIKLLKKPFKKFCCDDDICIDYKVYTDTKYGYDYCEEIRINDSIPISGLEITRMYGENNIERYTIALRWADWNSSLDYQNELGCFSGSNAAIFERVKVMIKTAEELFRIDCNTDE